ncbi:MAG: NAD(P)-dependent oxidoreductase [Bacteroidota bacterium]
MKTILITGASGFVGANLIQSLSPENRYLLLSRKERPEWNSLPGNFTLVKGELASLDKVNFPVSDIDLIVNLAAEIKDEALFRPTNITGVEKITRVATALGCKAIVHLSSVGVVGMQFSAGPVVVNEDAPCFPKNNYEITKLESERILKEYAAASGTHLVILRPTNVFGEHHPRSGLLNLLQHLKNGKPVPTANGAMVNYLYVGDLADTINWFIEHPGVSGTYNVGGGCTMDHFYSITARELGSGFKKITVPSVLVKFLEGVNYFGLTSIGTRLRGAVNKVTYTDERLLSVKPYRFGLETGIKNTIDHYIKKGKL